MKAKKPFRGFAISVAAVAALTSFCHLKAPKAIAKPLTTSHQGDWILYLKENASYAESGVTGNIWKVRPDGSDRTQLSHSGKCISPVWMPDHRRIAFVSNKQVYVMNSSGIGVKQLTHLKNWDIDAVDVSRDSKKIVFRAEHFINDDVSDVALFLMNVDGTKLRLIIRPKDISNIFNIRNPAFGVDSSTLLYVTCNWLEVGGAGLQKLTITNRRVSNLYGYSAEIDMNPKVIYSDSNHRHRPSSYYELYEPNLSPNGKRIACMCWGYNYTKENPKLEGDRYFDSKRIGIVVLNADGTNAQMIYPLSKSAADFWWWSEGGPDWSPDGRKLVFTTPSGLTIFDMATKRSQVIVPGKNLSWPAW
jgi:Tol biopolymer transport system component